MAWRLNLPVSVLFGCSIFGCHSAERPQGRTVDGEPGADSGDDSGIFADTDAGPDQDVFSEVPVGDVPTDGRSISVSGFYYIAGAEGFSGQSTLIDESFGVRGFSGTGIADESGQVSGDRCWITSAAAIFPDVDFGTRVPVVVGDDELWARREVYEAFDEEIVEYFGERGPRQQRYTAGEAVSIIGLAAGVVPEPVQFTERWVWEDRRTGLFGPRHLRLAWEPDADPDTYIWFFMSMMNDFELEADATFYDITCSLVDDGGSIIVEIPDVLTTDMFVAGVNVVRARRTWHDDPVLGVVRLTVGANTLLDGDPWPGSDARPAATDSAANRLPLVGPTLSGSTCAGQ